MRSDESAGHHHDISGVADFKLEADQAFELPFPQNGKALRVKIRALNLAQITTAEGAPRALAASGSVPDEEQMAAVDGHFKAIAERGIVAPAFSFGPDREAGKAWWYDLKAGNQTAIVVAIYRLSGTDRGGAVEDAKASATFPDKRKRR